jgi:hypothetical protein
LILIRWRTSLLRTKEDFVKLNSLYEVSRKMLATHEHLPAPELELPSEQGATTEPEVPGPEPEPSANEGDTQDLLVSQG